MNLNTIPKFVVNLKKREDRLVHIKKEMEYIGWDYELFEAVEINSHVGCTLSHLGILNIAKERGYDSVMVIEDDCCIFPYAKDFVEKLNETIGELDFGIFNLSPTYNRPVEVSKDFPLLNDITNLPMKLEHHRDIFATNMIIYNKSIYDDVFLISGSTLEPPFYIAIDQFISKYITTKKQSYSPILPISVQMSDWSDVSHNNYNNFYMQTYNWNLYCPHKIPHQFLDSEQIQKMKSDGIHVKLEL